MITITLGNSYSNIKGLTPEQEKSLRHALSYVVGGKSAYFSKFGPKRKSLLDKKGNFPSGLHSRVLKHMQLYSGAFISTDDVRVDRLRFVSFNPIQDRRRYYSWQIDAVNTALANSRGIISAPTGSGKSRTMELLCHAIGGKTLIVVPTIEIKKQLTEIMVPLCNVLNNITVENIDNPALKYMTDFDCLIIDEAHHAAAKTYHKLNKTAWNNIFYRFFFTATPFRNDIEETLSFEALAGELIYRLDYKTSVKEKYIVPIESYYIETPKQKTDAYGWKEVYNELVVNNETRNNKIGALLLRLNAQNLSSLCLVKEVAHGRILSALTGLPFVCGEDEESREYIQQFNSGKIKALIGTEGILGEGVDTKPCEYVIIAGLGKAKSNFMQKCGRSVRTYSGKNSAKVIIIKDTSHRFTRSHFATQRAILKDEYDSVPLKLEI